MSRKTLIFCLSTLAVMVLGIGIAVAFLYSGTQEDEAGHAEAVDGKGLLFAAVPSDAVIAASFSDVSKASEGMLACFPFFAELSEEISQGHLSALKRCPCAVSLHYTGDINALYVLQTGRADTDISKKESELIDFLSASGLYAERVDCSDISGVKGRLAKNSLVLASVSESVVKSSLRHLRKGVSVLDSPGFAGALSEVIGDDMLLVSNLQIGKLLPSMFLQGTRAYSSFLASVASWSAFALASDNGMLDLSGSFSYDSGPSDFMNVLESQQGGKITVAEILPAYTLSAFSLAVKDVAEWSESYRSYLNSRQKLQINNAALKSVENKLGISPIDYMKNSKVTEVAAASFVSASKVLKVNLMKFSNPDLSYIFKGLGVESLKDYRPDVHEYKYPGLASSIFGDLFSPGEETSFTYMNGWVISGSHEAVKTFIKESEADYSLASYIADAGQSGFISSQPAVFRSYCSISECLQPSVSIFTKRFADVASKYNEDCDGACVFAEVANHKKCPSIIIGLRKLIMQEVKTPLEARDTVVVVPKGPFKVKNSGTGKDNLFYQNKYLSICLQQEGKDLWGIPFKKPLCGTAYNVDYYANGKLQILFGAGDCLYLVDRLGRYVNGFPVSLGKEILLGPDVYDFNGTRRYNVMVLHKDHSIEMYNLKGQKPASWKGIKADEAIIGLPERIRMGDSSFWVVRTALQTLLYPFYGGEPLTVFEDNKRIRKDSEIKILDQATVEFTCFDGKQRSLTLK